MGAKAATAPLRPSADKYAEQRFIQAHALGRATPDASLEYASPPVNQYGRIHKLDWMTLGESIRAPIRADGTNPHPTSSSVLASPLDSQ